MYQQIKQLADDALALQNKNRMDAALREISALCDHAAAAQPEQPEPAEPAEPAVLPPAGDFGDAGDAVQEGGAQ
jgi:hypothetical protein